MFDLSTIRSVTLDISETYQDGALQEETAEFILKFLSQNYQIYLFSSNPKHSVALEDFEHPNLRFLREPMPPETVLAARFRDLTAETNLWITDDPDLAAWAVRHRIPLASRRPEVAGAQRFLRYHRIGELAEAMDPTARTIERLAGLLPAQAPGVPGGTRLIGIGGPPLGGMAELALALKSRLEAAGDSLVELLDVQSLVSENPASDGSKKLEQRGSIDPLEMVKNWITRARAGEAVLVEELPAGFPAEFDANLPLYLGAESIVIVIGGMLFRSGLPDLLDVTVLLEVSDQETTRRIYEIDETEFDEAFTEQYVSHDGRAYAEYLTRNQVRELATARVNADRPGVFRIRDEGRGQ